MWNSNWYAHGWSERDTKKEKKKKDTALHTHEMSTIIYSNETGKCQKSITFHITKRIVIAMIFLCLCHTSIWCAHA